MSNKTFHQQAATYAIFLLFLGSVPDLQAQRKPTYNTGLLNEAYTELAGARPIYGGHRARAMWHIRAAASQSRERISYRGRLCDPQAPDSDAKLQTAQNLLHQAKGGMSGNALNNVDRAINELSLALSIGKNSNIQRYWGGQRNWTNQRRWYGPNRNYYNRERQGSWTDQL